MYRGIKPQEGTGAPRAPLTCHCEERSDVAISQYPAASWESYRRKRNCLPEIATSAFGLLAMTSLGALHICRKYLQICSCQRRSLTAATDAIGAYRFHGGLYKSAVPSRDCHVASLLAMTSRGRLLFHVTLYESFVRCRERTAGPLQRSNGGMPDKKCPPERFHKKEGSTKFVLPSVRSENGQIPDFC